jgi:transglutaminase-like putative cysteine protease
MTAAAAATSLQARDERERRFSPEEGWAVVAIVVIIGLVIATAMDEPGWVNGRAALTDGLAWCAMGGAAMGLFGAKVGWGRWTTHLVGALVAGLVLPILAGWAVLPGLTAAEAFRFTANGTMEAYLDLTARGYQFTIQEVHYVLVLSGLVWATMQFGSFAIFGHKRPLSAVVVMGLVLILNMTLTKRDQLGWLVFYAGLSLFLLIQMHTVGERGTWTRRRIGDPGSISMLYLRGGTIFVVGAMIASMVLTFNATSNPLAGAWSGLNSQLVQISKSIGRLLPVGGDVRGGAGVSFGSSATISDQWFSDSGVAFTATVPASAAHQKFRAATYDTFAIGGWMQSEMRTADVPADTGMLADSPEVPDPDVMDAMKVTIHPAGFHDTTLLSLGLADKVNQPTKLFLAGLQGWFATDTIAADTTYTVTGLVPRIGGDDGITQNQLRAASSVYPADIQNEYTDVPAGAMGPFADQLLKTVLAKSPSKNPFDLASTIEQFLRSPAFSYSTDIRNINCERSAVECFAHFKIGYCQHYASTMAILLRAANPSNPIPTRYVQGFLASDIVGGQETVFNFQAHAWVEVYFPGYGWIPFDPTGGGIGRPQDIPVGAPVPSAPPPSIDPNDLGSGGPKATRRDFEPGAGGSKGGPKTPQPQSTDRGFAILIAVLLAGALGALIVVAWWRGPRGEVSPETAWAAVSKSASRFGFAPRPTQTVYEYASSLGELIPVAKPDIGTVADAKVETTYARTQLTPEREHAVAMSMRRLRVSLLRLIFTPRRRKKRR